MPLRNADTTNFIGIDSSVQSSKKLSAAKRMSSRPSAIARRSQRACLMSSGLCRRASLRPGVSFRHRLQNDAPPEVSVNLDVPFVPAGIDRVAPALFLEQLENRAEQMVAISSLVAPKNPASQSATRFGVGR